MSRAMTIILNGLPENIPPPMTVAQLIELFNEQDSGLAVDINGVFVHPRDFAARQIQEGDKVELIHLAFGG